MAPSLGCLPASMIVLSCSKASVLSSLLRVGSVSIAVWSSVRSSLMVGSSDFGSSGSALMVLVTWPLIAPIATPVRV